MTTPIPTPAAVGQVIQELRRERGRMSRDQLAATAQLSRGYLWSVETGKRNPGLVPLAAIAQALDIPLSQLIAHAECLEASASA